MNKIIEQFYMEHDFFEKEYLPDDEQERLNSLEPESEENPFEKYSYETNGPYDYRFFTKVPLAEAEFNKVVLIELLKNSEEMNKKQSTIRNILIFWCTLTIIGIILSLFALS